jgi:lactoylglutathione lyase
MTVFRNSFPIIYTSDIAAALAFYRDLLGFAETYRFPATGTEFPATGTEFPATEAEPEFVSLTLAGGGGLGLAAATDGQTGAHGQTLTPRTGRQFELCVYTDDVDAAVGELRRRGVPVLVEPADQPWGERMAYVADPDGHPVMICA